MVLAALAVTAGLAGCGTGSSSRAAGDASVSSSANLTVTVVEQVDFVGGSTAGAACYAGPANVTLTNENGSVLGQQAIPGRTSETPNGTYDPNGNGCAVHLAFGPVPHSAQYGVALGSASPVYFSAAQAQAASYDLAVTFNPEG